jgi:glucan biosynthesis protein C
MRSQKKRYYYLDHIRVALTILLLFHHASIAYGATGGWYYVEKGASGITSAMLTLFTAVNQAYFLGLFFFIAGYFTPGSYDRKGGLRFLADRFVRLGIPTLAYIFLLGPIVTYWVNYKDSLPFTEFYRTKIMTLEIVNWGPLWFAETLLYFALIYCCWRLMRPRRTHSTDPVPASMVAKEQTAATSRSVFPSNRLLLLTALLIGAVAFSIRLVFPVGQQFLGMQFGYFTSYIVLFVAGIQAYRNNWLAMLTKQQTRLWFQIAVIAIIVLPIFMISQGALGGKQLQVNGGANLQALVYAFWEPFVCIGMCMFVLQLFHDRFNKTSEWRKRLGNAAFGVYIIHPVILVGLSLLLQSVHLPFLLKWLIVGGFGTVVSFAISMMLRKIPYMDRIL